MKKNVKHIIREVPGEQADFNFYFDDDGLTSTGGDYCYNLFIVGQSRNASGSNEVEYKNIQNRIENLLEMYLNIMEKSNYAQYSSVGAMLKDYGLINDIHNTKKIKAYTDFFEECTRKPGSPYANYHDNFEAFNEEMTAKYLTLETGKEWSTESAHGYCQGDYVEMVYCKEHYKDGVKHYGEIWLGAGKEFSVIDLDENGEEADTRGGFIIADCQARTEEDYKKLVCEWAEIAEDEAQLEMIESYRTNTVYTYKAV